jgi:GNAT superfamily N-acetyltransferase
MAYWIREVDGLVHGGLLNYMNNYGDHFPQLQTRHLVDGHWWIAQAMDGLVVGFAGMVPMTPFDRVGYLKRAFVLRDHRGRGLQGCFLREREKRARQLGWTLLTSECGADNGPSQNNFLRAGFQRCEPEQAWGEPGSVYFAKRL